MPPRPSKSPAKGRSASPKPIKSPAAATAKSMAKEKTPTKATPKVTVKEAPPPSKAPEALKPEVEPSSIPPATPAPATPARQPATTRVLVGGFFGVLLALLGVLLSYSTAKPEPIGWVSAKLFDGTTLKMESAVPARDASSALLLFMTRQEECDACVSLKAEIGSSAFLSLAAAWKKAKLLKMAKVKCWKHEELCRSFGVAGDEPETSTGYPAILHFKGGQKVGFVNERTADGLQKWVTEKQEAGAL